MRAGRVPRTPARPASLGWSGATRERRGPFWSPTCRPPRASAVGWCSGGATTTASGPGRGPATTAAPRPGLSGPRWSGDTCWAGWTPSCATTRSTTCQPSRHQQTAAATGAEGPTATHPPTPASRWGMERSARALAWRRRTPPIAAPAASTMCMLFRQVVLFKYTHTFIGHGAHVSMELDYCMCAQGSFCFVCITTCRFVCMRSFFCEIALFSHLTNALFHIDCF